jgi:hypothetical protein
MMMNVHCWIVVSSNDMNSYRRMKSTDSSCVLSIARQQPHVMEDDVDKQLERVRETKTSGMPSIRHPVAIPMNHRFTCIQARQFWSIEFRRSDDQVLSCTSIIHKTYLVNSVVSCRTFTIEIMHYWQHYGNIYNRYAQQEYLLFEIRRSLTCSLGHCWSK